MPETFDWLKPAPLWAKDGSDIRADLFVPTLLRFTTDQFMDDFFRLAQSPMPNALQPALLDDSGNVDTPGKLFQPAHSRYYLVCASLCCRQPGFPSRVVQRADGDSIYFVLRKFSSGVEYGWTISGEEKKWQQVSGDVLPNEERLPLFTTVTHDNRLLAVGYVPVSSRETYKTTVPIPTPDTQDTRINQFTENVTRPLTALLANPGAIKADVIEELSVFMLLDMIDFFTSTMPEVVTALPTGTTGLSSGEQALLTYLQGIHSTATGSPSLADALKDAADNAPAIRALNGGDPLPIHYSLSEFSGLDAQTLESRVNGALPTFDPTKQPASQDAELPKLQTSGTDRFALRCVYERDCDTPLPPQRIISRASVLFELAGFFDGDAPARPIRITLPTDISIAAMRKFQKSVGFQMSNAMRNKMAMVTGHEKDLLKDPPQPGGEGGFTLGFICSFSIQIIFIVAFMLLLIFVFVLNIVFWWLPFFRICLPIPLPARKS